MNRVIRKQVLLEPWQDKWIKVIAKRLGVSYSQALRMMVVKCVYSNFNQGQVYGYTDDSYNARKLYENDKDLHSIRQACDVRILLHQR